MASFTDTLRLPRAFWFVIGAFVVDSMAYFGVLTLMSSYLSSELGWGDVAAGIMVSLFTMSMTLFMLGLGSFAEGFGLRRAILAALALCTVGRLVYSGMGMVHGGVAVTAAVIAAIFVTAVGEAILQPVCYSGVKQYTDEKTSVMGYALIYAIMNALIVAAGTLSAWIRPAVQDVKDGHATTGGFVGWLAGVTPSGIDAVNWVFTGVTALTFVGFFVVFTRKAEAEKLRPDPAEEQRLGATKPRLARLKEYFTEGPFRNPRFLFFIFMLLPVRTLFAHQWLTFPQYILRAYDKDVADHMEWLVNWINPGVIFIGVPLTAALTKRINVYTMMIVGSLVSALPTFLLVGGPDLTRLITYFVVFSIGEALWSARFLEYASELAPPGRVAQYMGLANIPWLLAKGTTGFYSGYMLSRYCAEGVPPAQQHTGTMFLIYGCIAMLSPIGLFAARKWVMAGLHTARAPARAAN
ncbi:MFS transporter [Horticoccus luteus]|uniref:MFS transporter n=1 Tax=Horticoccus luteus TaxID=2862869 RepID=A0A8F9TVF7_9BACT|nr:MFS transporter [Horticoccus luteus]QYM79846.1 MFS transporter [Horticoccus luteus]